MRYLLIFTFIITFFPAFSQGGIERKSSWADNLYFGGGLGLQFGSVTGVEVSPMVAYQFHDRFYMGGKASYEYYKTEWYETSIYGGSLFSVFNFYDSFLLYAEAEALNYVPAHFAFFSNDFNRKWIVSPLAGPGFIQPIGEKSKLLLLLLWNLNETYESPYSNPIVRITFLF